MGEYLHKNIKSRHSIIRDLNGVKENEESDFIIPP